MDLPLLTNLMCSFGCKQQKLTLVSFRLKTQEAIKYQGKTEQPRPRQVKKAGPPPGTSAAAGGFASQDC